MRWAFRSFVLSTFLFAAAAVLGAPAQARESGLTGYEPGTIVVKTAERRLYLIGNGDVRSYPIAVGKPGWTWTGVRYIDGKHIKPAWSAPADIRKPGMPDVIPAGSPSNPMGAAAMTLSNSEYAIHGTNNPRSIGTPASSGCIRMHNHDVMDLFQRVHVGTKVVVLP
jgi:lipoprotein-anchoring transpeptidase ErfK/SrfK